MAQPIAVETAAQAKRRVSRHGGVALTAMLAPAVLFPMLLLLASTHPQFAFLREPRRWPLELYLIALFGTCATLGGVLDWRFHRSGDTSVGRPEHKAHVLALASGGIPLFLLMTAASALPVATRPLLLIPIIVVAIYTCVLICYDEFQFHTRRCDTFETITHRLLVLGNTIAWLAWMHWCFVRTARSAV